MTTFSSFCSSPPPTTPTSRPLTGIRSTPCATPLERRQSGHLAEPLPHTSREPESCIDVSSEHSLISHPSRRNSFNIENDLTTVAASENFDGFQKQAAANGCLQPVPANEVKTRGSTPTCGPALGHWCEVSRQMQVLKGLCREEKEIKIWKVCKLCLESKIYMSTWSRKLNWLFKENARLRDVHLRLKQTWK